MNRRSSGVALTRALVFVGLLGLACSHRAKAKRRGPFLSILRQDQARAQARDRAQNMGASIALALGGLPPDEMSHLREHLEESTEAALRRAAPMVFDLGLTEEDDAPDLIHQALPDVPAMTAAANVLSAPWSGLGLCVGVGSACDAGALRCVPLFEPTLDRGDELVRRGRALAWSLANAAPVRVPPSSHAMLLRSLRQAQTRPSSTIALVFGASRGVLDEAELEPLREQARRALVHLPPGAPLRPWLEALGAARADWELPFALDADELLVIPRLSALARLRDFRAEVEFAIHRL